MPVTTGKDELPELIKVALGKAEADLAIVNGSIVNVYTGELLPGETVLIKGSRIAYAGKDGKKAIGSSTQLIDVSGKVLIPGLIDGHAHIAYEYSISEVLKYAMTGGTTTIVTETCDIAYPFGYQGVIQFLRSIKDQPIKIFITAPPMASISPLVNEHAITLAQLHRLLRRKEVVGLGESYWAQVIGGEQRILTLIAETIRAGKKVEGHSSGAKEAKLQAYVSTGVSSCHEPITPDEVAERLRLGLSVLLREGEVRRELEAVAPIKERNISLGRLAFGSDGIGPWQLTTDGYMEFVVQKAINLGFDPIAAVQMATINVAQHFGMDNFIGGIAPGKYADIVILPDMRVIKAEYVISNGQVVARAGRLLVEPRNHHYPRSMGDSVHLPPDFGVDNFAIRVRDNRQQVKVRVIDQVTSLVTREAILDMPLVNGQLIPDPGRNILKVAAIDRWYQPGKTFTGFIRGIGLKRGAIATSAGGDSADMIVVGVSDNDMLQAIKRVRELNGGVVIWADNRVLAEIAFPVNGTISTEPMGALSDQLRTVQKAAEELGCVSPDIRLTLAFLSSPAVAHLRICEHGLFSLRENQFVDLIVE